MTIYALVHLVVVGVDSGTLYKVCTLEVRMVADLMLEERGSPLAYRWRCTVGASRDGAGRGAASRRQAEF